MTQGRRLGSSLREEDDPTLRAQSGSVFIDRAAKSD
jgi:hypothetical protein